MRVGHFGTSKRFVNWRRSVCATFLKTAFNRQRSRRLRASRPVAEIEHAKHNTHPETARAGARAPAPSEQLTACLVCRSCHVVPRSINLHSRLRGSASEIDTCLPRFHHHARARTRAPLVLPTRPRPLVSPNHTNQRHFWGESPQMPSPYCFAFPFHLITLWACDGCFWHKFTF